MNYTPVPSLSPEELQRRTQMLYPQLANQAKSYYRSRNLGQSSSIPTELAQDLFASMLFTLEQVGGLACCPDPVASLYSGQALLKAKYEYAQRLLLLAETTTDPMHSEGRWDALRALRHWLQQYDFVHLAHHGPETLYYPWILPMPHQLQGIDAGIFLLNQLCLENQILDAIPHSERAAVLLSFGEDDRALTENACEAVLAQRLRRELAFLPPSMPQQRVETAVQHVAQQLQLTDPDAYQYILQAARNLLAREHLLNPSV